MVTFGQTLLTLKIYSARNVYYRFSALITSARTQPMPVDVYGSCYFVAVMPLSGVYNKNLSLKSQEIDQS